MTEYLNCDPTCDVIGRVNGTLYTLNNDNRHIVDGMINNLVGNNQLHIFNRI